ncbi:MAG: CoA transferase, partial [Gammaproteobacteria bacterium]|nr:CoA transferase [Gammaproteobacteria bacterium]
MTIADHDVARRALAELLSIGGYDAAEPTEPVAITPEEIALDTRFHIQEAGAAALAAGGFVASKLLDKQGSVHVATRHAEASLQSYHHVRFDNADKEPVARSATPGRDLIAGFQRTADGRWMYIHPSFEANTLALLELFGHPQDADAARRAIGQWDAPDLERTIWERGLCSAMLRTADEWDACEQGQILNALPVVEIIQIGDAPPRSHEPGDRPLDGYKVLDLTRVLAGPTCARTLTSYGAQALRVAGEGLPHVPQFVAETGMGKRSAYIDLKSADGKTTLNGLVAESDVFSQGYRSGALERLGFGVQDVVAMHPGIVYVSIN